MRLGLIGCGAVASRFHIPAIKTIPEIKLEAVADVDLNHAEKFASVNSVDRVYSNHNEMLDDCPLDAVLVCTPPRTHARIVLDSIMKGRHVMCEKPFVLHSKEAEMIAKRDEDSIVFPAHNYIFTPSLTTVRDSVKAGKFELTGIRAEIGVGFWSWRSRTEYRTDDQYGVIDDLLYHAVYVVNHLNRINAVTDVRAHRKSNGVIDEIDAKVQLENGAEATLSAYWTSIIPRFRLFLEHKSGTIGLDLMKRPYGISGQVNPRTLQINPRMSRLGEIQQLIMGRHPSFALEHMNFLRAAEFGEDQEVTVEEALDTVMILEEIKARA